MSLQVKRTATDVGSSRHRLPSSSGFSLVEVLVATALTGMVTLGVASMMGMAVSATGAAQEITALTVVAVDQLELLNSQPFSDDLLAAGGDLTRSLQGYSIDPLDDNRHAYMRWEVADVSFTLKRITVVVGLRDATTGTDREASFETFRILAQ